MSSPTRKIPTLRKISRFVYGVGSLIAVIGIILCFLHIITPTQFCIRILIIAAISFTLLRLYPRFLTYLNTQTLDPNTLLQAAPGMFMMVWCYIAIFIMLIGTRLSYTMSSFWIMPPIMIGVAIIGAGVMRRVGDSRHCPHCDYLYAFDKDEDAPTRCPECGKGWLGILKTGRKIKSLKLIFIGLAFAIIATACLNPIFYIGSLARHLPTPLLFASSYLLPTNSHVAWDELASRKLSPYWTSVMARRVLSLRATSPFNTSTRWFEQNSTSGAIAPDLQERFFVEGFKASLLVPDRAQVNQPLTAALRVTHLVSGDKFQTGVMFAGYYIDDSLTPIGRSDKTIWAFEMRPDVFSSSRDCLAQPITFTTKGEHKVRAVYWVAYLPSFNDPLKWQPDCTPAPIPSALWSKRYEFSKTIRVE